MDTLWTTRCDLSAYMHTYQYLNSLKYNSLSFDLHKFLATTLQLLLSHRTDHLAPVAYSMKFNYL